MTSEDAAQVTNQRWSGRQALAAVAVAAVIGGIGGAAIYAATEQPAHMMGGGPHAVAGPMHGPPAGGMPQGGPPAAAAAPPATAGAVHSEYVVSDGNGGFTTKMTQTGTVDEVTLTDVVVRSGDGYTQMYTFPPGASRSVQPNDTVTVEATRSGATVTLNSIGDTPPAPN